MLELWDNEAIIKRTDQMEIKMRKSKRQTSQAEALSILENSEYGIMSIVDPADNEPYGVPLNFCLISDAIYFHCAGEGKKIEIMTANPNVSFCVVGKTEIDPEGFTTKFESSIVKGLASEVFDAEKQIALEHLIKKYSSEFVSEGVDYIKRVGPQTTVYKITIESITGKASR